MGPPRWVRPISAVSICSPTTNVHVRDKNRNYEGALDLKKNLSLVVRPTMGVSLPAFASIPKLLGVHVHRPGRLGHGGEVGKERRVAVLVLELA